MEGEKEGEKRDGEGDGLMGLRSFALGDEGEHDCAGEGNGDYQRQDEGIEVHRVPEVVLKAGPPAARKDDKQKKREADPLRG